MTKRERVEAAMSFRGTDRVPVYDSLRSDSCIEYYAGRRPNAQDGLRISGQAIASGLDMTRKVRGPANPGRPVSGHGFVYQIERWRSWVVGRPFDDLAGLKPYVCQSIRAAAGFHPDAEYARRFRAAFLDAQEVCGDTVIVLTMSGTGLDAAYNEAGYELFCYLMADDSGLMSEWLEALFQAEIRRIHAIADVSLSPVVVTYANIAMKEKLLFSPGFLRREFFPRLARIHDAWHEHGFKCLFQSHGNVTQVLPDIVQASSDGLSCIEVGAGMDLSECKRRYGDRLFLCGGIDESHLLPYGSPKEVRQACEEAIRVAGEGSGYMIGSTGEIHEAVPAENFRAMVETAHSHSLSGLCGSKQSIEVSGVK